MLKLALAGLVAAVLAAGAASALAQEASETRISARRLDGRIEFALQQGVGGSWGARVLPSSRHFPANAAAGRWFNSSPVGDVRISARRLADGRVEFALQPRAGGGWGERVLPSSRHFPANAAAGRWFNSSPVGDVRISARRLADGRVEFALQPRAGGGWGERILPSSRRYFPPHAASGRWLNSSPVTIGGAAMARTRPPPVRCRITSAA